VACCALIACGGKLAAKTGEPTSSGRGAAGGSTIDDKPTPDNPPPAISVPIDDPGSGTTTGGGGLPMGTGQGGSAPTMGSADASTTGVPPWCMSGPELPVAPCNCPSTPMDAWYCGSGGPSITATLDPSGGEVTLSGAGGCQNGVLFSLKVPPGAVTKPLTIKITETALPPKRFAATTPGYVIEPLDLEFAIPASLRIPWGNTSSATQGFSIYTAPSTCAEPAKLPDSYVNAGFLQGTTQRLGIFFAGTPNG
jgi:hypothetical protein